MKLIFGRYAIFSASVLACTVFLSDAVPANAADSDDAELYKKNCQACHTLEKGGARRQGPNLWGLFDRPIGKVKNFPYSSGLKNETRHWDVALLNKWLENPKGLFADTYMNYKQPDPALRLRLIDYLEKATME